MSLKTESYSIFSSHVQPISVRAFTYFWGEVAISSSQSNELIIFSQKIVSHYFPLHLIMMTLLLGFFAVCFSYNMLVNYRYWSIFV